MRIFIKDLTGKTVTLDPVYPRDKIGAIKCMIRDVSRIQVANQRLIFGSKVLDDDSTLFDNYIQNDHTIILYFTPLKDGASMLITRLSTPGWTDHERIGEFKASLKWIGDHEIDSYKAHMLLRKFENDNLRLSFLRFMVDENKIKLDDGAIAEICGAFQCGANIRHVNMILNEYQKSNAVASQSPYLKDLVLTDKRPCPICIQYVPDWSLKCGHVFCGACLDKFSNGKCPFCRVDVAEIKRLHV